MLPIELTASTNSSAGWSAASIAARTPAMSLVTPVAVSLCVASTALIVWSVSAVRISWYFSTGTPSPHSASTTSTSRPSRSHMSIQSRLNWPKREASTLSPGDRVLVRADSQPPVPVDGKTIGVAVVVLNTGFSPSMTACVSSGTLGERWSSMETTIACCTRSGMLVGPGTKRKLRPAIFRASYRCWIGWLVLRAFSPVFATEEEPASSLRVNRWRTPVPTIEG